jgi:hypothetical protein
MQLADVEEAFKFKHLKSDLVLRPILHKKEVRLKSTFLWSLWPTACK